MVASKLKSIFLAIIAILFTFALILYPKQSLDASLHGMMIWADVVFPSLLPFFIVSELLIGFGVVTLVGTLLEPVMRPLFRVPGAGSFALAVGLASGNPVGAKITARLREENELTQIEAERLVCFTNCANPLFIYGAVAVGFFHDARLGLLMATAHYVGNILVGFIMRFHGNQHEKINPAKKISFKTALRSMHYARLNDGRKLGTLLGDAVHSSIRTLLMIGGFIMLFSVLTNVFSLLGITVIFAKIISLFLVIFQLPELISIPFISGIFEMTLGTKLISELHEVTLLKKVVAASFIIGFGGFSIQAQVASILSSTDIRFHLFFFSRLLHGFISASLIYILWQPLYIKMDEEMTRPVFSMINEKTSDVSSQIWLYLHNEGVLITISALILFLYLLMVQHTKKDSRN